MTKPLNHDLLGHLYDGVMAPIGFQLFIEKLVEVFDLKAVTMVIRHVETQEVKSLWLAGITRQWVESYSLEYARDDVLAQHIMTAPIANFYASNLDVSLPASFPGTRFYNEWLAPQGVAFAAGAVVLQEGPWVTQLILQRAPQHAPFEREEMEHLNQLVPHLQRAIQMRQRLADLQLDQRFLAGGLDMLAMPTFLFDEYAKVTHYNRSATHLLTERTLWLEEGHLQAKDSGMTRKLGLEITKSIAASRNKEDDLNSVVLLPRNDKLPLMLMIAPLHLTGTPRTHGAALMFAFDPEATPTVTIDLVRRLFKLSNAEAELSIALCIGKTLDEVAIERGTSIHTVKSQLKNIYLKTGTKRQPELVSMLLASPAFFIAQKQLGQIEG
ncbi:MAG: helix-turn-helix transcriptional regulator [Pseudomonadota bacterium]